MSLASSSSSANGSSNTRQNMTIGDDNPSLRLSQGWQQVSSRNTLSGSYQFAKGIEDGLQLLLPPNTVAFYYYGLKQAEGGLYGICVDCSTNSSGTLFDTIDGHQNSQIGNNSVVLYSKEDLDSSVSHSLALVNFPDERFANTSTITFDAFVVTVEAPSSSETSSGITSGSTGMPPRSDAIDNHLSSGAIVGIVIGVISGFIITVVTFIYLLRWCRRRRKPFIQIQQISYPVTTDLPARRRDLLVRSGFMDRYPQFSFRQDVPQVNRSRSGILTFLENGQNYTSSAGDQHEAQYPRTQQVLAVFRERVSQRFSRARNDSFMGPPNRRSRLSRQVTHRVSNTSRGEHGGARRSSHMNAERASRLFSRERSSDQRPSISVAVDNSRRTSLSSISSWGSSQYDTIHEFSPTTQMPNDTLRMSRPFPSPPLHQPRLDGNWELL